MAPDSFLILPAPASRGSRKRAQAFVQHVGNRLRQIMPALNAFPVGALELEPRRLRRAANLVIGRWTGEAVRVPVLQLEGQLGDMGISLSDESGDLLLQAFSKGGALGFLPVLFSHPCYPSVPSNIVSNTLHGEHLSDIIAESIREVAVMMEYPMQRCTTDGWDVGQVVAAGISALSLACTLFSENPRLRKSFGPACFVVGIAGIVAKAVIPPKCQSCCARSVSNSTYWVCPNCQTITGKVWMLPPLS